MKKLIQVAALISVALLPIPNAFGVVPAPDGGYPGFTTAEGTKALQNLTTGSGNTGLGWFSLFSDTAGSFNTGVGAGTLLFNDADSNTAIGTAALLNNTAGEGNTATGTAALLNNTTASWNSAFGYQALNNNQVGTFNSALGYNALRINVNGADNTAIGHSALFGNTGGHENTACGALTLIANTTGNNNVSIGYLAGANLTTGDNNIDIGSNVPGVAGESNTIRIGSLDITDTYIRGISGATASGGAAVFVNGNGKLGTMTSSARVKDEIKPIGKASEAILALNPVSFRYKKEIDPERIPQFGLVAEEVERVNPDLVIRDADGRPLTVRYEQIHAMLLNEFLKQHRAFAEEQRKVEKLEATVAGLAETVKQQAAELRRVSAQVDHSAAQLVVNND